MTKIVYWAPWGPVDQIAEQFLSYSDPVNVLQDLQSSINKENKQDNFLNCPAFTNQYKNTWLLNSPTFADIEITSNGIVGNNDTTDKHLIIKQPSLLNSHTIKVSANWIFFCEESLHLESMHPFMHKTSASDYGYYVPGGFDINQWFRPLEYAYQMYPNETKFKILQGEPMMYVRANTTDRVIFKKFRMTEELFNHSLSCVRLKTFWKQRSLAKLYSMFNESKIKKNIIQEIKKNVME